MFMLSALIADTAPNPLGLCLVIAGSAAFALVLFEIISFVQRTQYPDMNYDLETQSGQYRAFMARFSRGHWRRYVEYVLLAVTVLSLVASGVVAIVGY
jgi:hypothetical protein